MSSGQVEIARRVFTGEAYWHSLNRSLSHSVEFFLVLPHRLGLLYLMEDFGTIQLVFAPEILWLLLTSRPNHCLSQYLEAGGLLVCPISQGISQSPRVLY